MALGLAAGGALLGGIAGAMGNQSSGTSRRSIGGQTQLGKDIDKMSGEELKNLQQFAGVFGLEDVQAGRQAQLGLAEMLQQMSASGGLPTGGDITAARGQAQSLFAGQRAGLQNLFSAQTEQANRQAASMGRSTNDPILQAQLRRSQIGAEREIMGQEQAMTQRIASSLPLQRLQFAQQRTGVLAGLGGQATALRSNLLGVGTNIQNQLNAIRLGQGTTTQSMTSGGGLQGALTGGLGGAGAALGLANGYNSLMA